MVQSVEGLPSKHKALDSIPCSLSAGHGDTSLWPPQLEVGGSESHSRPGLGR